MKGVLAARDPTGRLERSVGKRNLELRFIDARGEEDVVSWSVSRKVDWVAAVEGARAEGA